MVVIFVAIVVFAVIFVEEVVTLVFIEAVVVVAVVAAVFIIAFVVKAFGDVALRSLLQRSGS